MNKVYCFVLTLLCLAGILFGYGDKNIANIGILVFTTGFFICDHIDQKFKKH